MEPLNAQMGELGRQMSVEGERMRAAHAPMQALGEQMREAGEPMQALGEKMRVLGKQQERLSRQADATVRTVIEQALRDGKAERSDRLMAY